ncbi:hypothetical protein GGR56DRAFT_197644 [Xylariaceae sp. FL0804]|nr:hypothetical protein GGR56DRAFT_197644 [Xylariaceae sp. FL0804]
MANVPVYIPMTDPARMSLIAISVLWAVGAIVVFLRVLGRWRGVGIGVDDVLAVVALAFSGTTVGLNASVFTSGVGYNFDPSIPQYPKLLINIVYIMQVTFGFELIYLYCLTSLKLSQLFFYRRMFDSSRTMAYAIWSSIGMVAVWSIAYTFIFIFLCDPIRQQWSMDRIGHCLNQITVLKSLILTNIATDLVILVLPLRTIWTLQMRLMEKVVVTACFGFGIAVIIIGIVRFVLIFQIDLLGNLTGSSLTTFMLCTLELMLAILCTNTPMLRPWYVRWRNRATNSKRSQSTDRHTFNDPTSSARSRSGAWSKTGASASARAQQQPNHWFELQTKADDKGSDDGDSQQGLTNQPDGIAVQTHWKVTRE